MLFSSFVILRLILLGSLVFKDVSKRPATSVMKLFSNLVNNVLLITNVARNSVLNVERAPYPPLLLKVIFFRVTFLRVLVYEFALTFGLLLPCIFNTAYTHCFLKKLDTCVL